MTENTIILKSRAHREEGVADAAITPGMAIELAADGKYDPVQATLAEFSKGVAGLKIATEDSLQGKTITDAYAQGDLLFYFQPQVGDHFAAFVKSGANIAVGDTLTVESAGSGLWIEAAGTETSYRAEALESSGGALAANTHLKVRCISN